MQEMVECVCEVRKWVCWKSPFHIGTWINRFSALCGTQWFTVTIIAGRQWIQSWAENLLGSRSCSTEIHSYSFLLRLPGLRIDFWPILCEKLLCVVFNVIRAWHQSDYKLQVAHTATLHTSTVSVFMSANSLVGLYYYLYGGSERWMLRCPRHGAVPHISCTHARARVLNSSYYVQCSSNDLFMRNKQAEVMSFLLQDLVSAILRDSFLLSSGIHNIKTNSLAVR